MACLLLTGLSVTCTQAPRPVSGAHWRAPKLTPQPSQGPRASPGDSAAHTSGLISRLQLEPGHKGAKEGPLPSRPPARVSRLFRPTAGLFPGSFLQMRSSGRGGDTGLTPREVLGVWVPRLHSPLPSLMTVCLRPRLSAQSWRWGLSWGRDPLQMCASSSWVLRETAAPSLGLWAVQSVTRWHVLNPRGRGKGMSPRERHSH